MEKRTMFKVLEDIIVKQSKSIESGTIDYIRQQVKRMRELGESILEEYNNVVTMTLAKVKPENRISFQWSEYRTAMNQFLDERYCAVVYSSNGEITINPETGYVIKVEPTSGLPQDESEKFIREFEDVQFDLNEYKDWYEVDELPLNYDILDLGFCSEKTNVDPDYDYRNQIADDAWNELKDTLVERLVKKYLDENNDPLLVAYKIGNDIPIRALINAFPDVPTKYNKETLKLVNEFQKKFPKYIHSGIGDDYDCPTCKRAMDEIDVTSFHCRYCNLLWSMKEGEI